MQDVLRDIAVADRQITENLARNTLGFFWNSVFQERETIRGYTQGLVNETHQLFDRLIDAVNEQSLISTPITDYKRWQPITLLRSKFNRVPLRFEENAAVFGQQFDDVFRDQIFEFGGVRQSLYGYAVEPGAALLSVESLLVSPVGTQTVLVRGTDYTVVGNLLYFKEDLFVQFADQVNPAVDELGRVVDSAITFWSPQSEEDVTRLQRGYGRLLNWEDDTSEAYKSTLLALLAQKARGVTIADLADLLKAVLNTDAQVSVIDHTFSREWWRQRPFLALSGQLFNGKYIGHLMFRNTDAVATFDGTNIRFPVEGYAADVETWHRYINDPANQPRVRAQLGLQQPTSRVVNQVEFLMTNFLGHGQSFVQVEQVTLSQLSKLQHILQIIRPYTDKQQLVLWSVVLDTEPLLLEPVIDDTETVLMMSPPSHPADTLAAPVQAGTRRTYIPLGASTREVRTVLLVDF